MKKCMPLSRSASASTSSSAEVDPPSGKVQAGDSSSGGGNKVECEGAPFLPDSSRSDALPAQG